MHMLTRTALHGCAQGIAGSVAVTGEMVNIPDAYADPRFDPVHDQRTGARAAA